MAKLSEEEILTLKARGLYVREKCDNCSKPLLEPLSYTGRGANKKETWCCKCATGAGMGHVLARDGKLNETGVNLMATKTEKKVVEKKGKVLDSFREGTPMGDLASILLDEKPHKLESILPPIRKTYKLADAWRGLGPLKSIGEKKGLWGVILDKEKGTVQIKLGKPAKKAEKPVKEEKVKVKAAEKSTPPVKKAPEKKVGKVAKKKEESEEEVAEEQPDATPVSSKQQGAVGRLVRGTLKTGKEEWTRNKLIERLQKDHQIEPKRVLAAISDEISKGGILEENGLLSLV